MGFFDKEIDLKKFNPTLINYINDAVKNNIFGTTTIILDNTENLNTEILKEIIKSSKIKFKIKGGYDDQRIQLNKDKTYLMDGKIVNANVAYENPIIYTRDELYNILSKIEYLELNIDKDFTDLEKTVAIYELLRKNFNLNYNTDASGMEKRSLRGFVTKKLDCSGFSLLLKELLNRQNIRCDFVEGILSNENLQLPHAWNIIYVDGKFISADITNDVVEYKYSHKNNPSYLGEINSFSETHIPGNFENIQYYENALTPISTQLLLEAKKNINKDKISDVAVFNRSDNSRGIISVVGDEIFGDTSLKKLVCYEELDGKLINPIILYTDSNIYIQNNSIIIDENPVKMDVTEPNLFSDKLLHKTNITTSIATSSGYAGSIKNINGLEYSFTPNMKEKIPYSQKTFNRTNGTSFVLEQRVLSPKSNGTNTYEYYMYEFFNSEQGPIIKEFPIFTEKDIFNNTSKDISDVFLSKENIEENCLNRSGYLEYYNPSDIKTIEKSNEKILKKEIL